MALPAIPVLLLQYGYLSIFFGVAIGGEILILAVGFLSSLGYFNILLAILVATLGVIIADTFFYLLGRIGRKQVFHRVAKFFRISKERIEKSEKFFKKHDIKAMLLVRFVYGLRAMTLIIAGVSKMKYHRFFFYNFIGTFTWALILGILGYFFGESYEIISEYVENIILSISIGAIIGVIILLIITLIKKYIIQEFKLNNGNKSK
jgi:membrane-associated protein